MADKKKKTNKVAVPSLPPSLLPSLSFPHPFISIAHSLTTAAPSSPLPPRGSVLRGFRWW